MISYLETSAAAKLLVEEAESSTVAEHLDSLAAEEAQIVSSMLVETELRRLAHRQDLEQSAVTMLLERVDLIEPNRSLFYEAGLLPGKHLRSLDALHVATALRAEADEFLAYDTRQSEAATDVGLRVNSPT